MSNEQIAPAEPAEQAAPAETVAPAPVVEPLPTPTPEQIAEDLAETSHGKEVPQAETPEVAPQGAPQAAPAVPAPETPAADATAQAAPEASANPVYGEFDESLRIEERREVLASDPVASRPCKAGPADHPRIAALRAEGLI